MLEAILGQPEGVAYLRKVIDGGFTLPLLLVGEEGTGRRLSVFEAAKTVFEESQHQALAHGSHPDFRLLQCENDKDIKVESIRDVLEETSALPAWGPLKFVVIDGADRLTSAAANALLKELEEPPPKVRYFLLAERLDHVIPTIRSRCAVVSYRRLPESLILSKLAQITEDDLKARVICRMAEGSLGRATRYLVSGQLSLRDDMALMLSLASRNDLFAAFSAVDEAADKLSLGLCFLGQLLRDVLLLPVAPDHVIHVDVLGTLQALGDKLKSSTIRAILSDLRVLRERSESAINLAFHVKSMLASVAA